MKLLSGIKNMFNFTSPVIVDGTNKRLNSTIIPIQLERIRQDVLNWRCAIEEMERAYFPFRVQTQQLFNDTILNGHVVACRDRRKDLTLLRDWQIKTGKKVDEKTTKLLTDSEIMVNAMPYILDALFFGYSLIQLGDITAGKFKDVQIVKRWNVSPDRTVVSAQTYNPEGVNFLTDPLARKWHVWVPTPSDTGASKCGYGLLYNVAVYEIFLRNILGYNGDFVELFAQPYRIGKTNKTEEAERAAFEATVRNMGSAGYAIMDDIGDEILFLEAKNSGTAWQSYDNFEQRLEKKISKIILGHADALDSVPGKLGNDGEESPAAKALKDKKTKDGDFVTSVINNDLLPRMRELGFPIPMNAVFEFKNDEEVFENNNRTVEMAEKIYKSGLQMDPAYFEKETGIKLKEPEPVVEPGAVPGDEKKPGEKLPVNVKNKLEELYK